jgi:hypothetical protein
MLEKIIGIKGRMKLMTIEEASLVYSDDTDYIEDGLNKLTYENWKIIRSGLVVSIALVLWTAILDHKITGEMSNIFLYLGEYILCSVLWIIITAKHYLKQCKMVEERSKAVYIKFDTVHYIMHYNGYVIIPHWSIDAVDNLEDLDAESNNEDSESNNESNQDVIFNVGRVRINIGNYLTLDKLRELKESKRALVFTEAEWSNFI